MSKKGLLSIVILNYNGMNFLENCIESIVRETNHENEIIVVDNKSPDSSGEVFSKKYPKIKFILNKKNVGVPEGLNIGIKNSNGEYIVLLNNDLVVTPDWFQPLLEAYKKNGIALYQPKFVKMTDSSIIDGVGNMINIFGFGFAREKGMKDNGQYSDLEEISYASGTCMFAPRKIFDEIGLFDEKFFAYHEELDIGWRARLFGYNSYFVPQSVIKHFGSASWKWSGEKFYLLERNRWLVLLKNYSIFTLLRLLPSLLLIEFFMLGFFASKKLLKKKIQSYISIIKLRKHIKEQRKVISRKRRLSDSEIMNSFCGSIKIPPEADESNMNEKFNKILKTLCKLNRLENIVRDI